MNLLEVHRVDLAVAEAQQQVLVGQTVRGHGVVQGAHRAGQGVRLLHRDGRDGRIRGTHLGGSGGGGSGQVSTVAASAGGRERGELGVVDHAFVEGSGRQLRALCLVIVRKIDEFDEVVQCDLLFIKHTP